MTPPKILFLAAGVSVMTASLPEAKTLEQPRPNVILCMCDDLGWGDVGYNGNKIIKTPNLDRMAAEGIKFERFYSAAPVCSPTRASCLNGRHPYRTGVFFANTGILRPEEITIAEILRNQGYATGHFGKWHLGTFSKTENDANRGGREHPELYNPPSLHGFDTYFSTESKVPTWDPMIYPAEFKGEENIHVGWNAVKPGEKTKQYGTYYWTPEGKATDNLGGDDSRVIMDRALPFIEKNARQGKPFLAAIWFHTPHLPCVAGPEYARLYQDQNFEMRQYAGCITAMDEQMGRLRDKLKQLDIDDNTILWFTSDNGPEGNCNAPGSAGNYKGRKRSLHEGGVRVPGLMTWPDKISKPMVIDTPVVTSDYLPTVVDALNIAMPDNANELDGVSMIPLLQGKKLKRPSPIGFVSQKQRVFNDERYKLYHTRGAKFELYDMLEDPYEKRNIAEKHPDIVAEFKKGFDKWYSSCRDSFEGKEYGTKSFDKLKQSWPYSQKKSREQNKTNKK